MAHIDKQAQDVKFRDSLESGYTRYFKKVRWIAATALVYIPNAVQFP